MIKTLSSEEKQQINPSLLNIIDYRKSGLSLNHIVGCPLDCAYCVRHFFDNFEMKKPAMLCTNKEAVDELIGHRYFIPNVTPIQIFNRATDPFLASVKPHTHEVLSLLDQKGWSNPVLVITRSRVAEKDIEQLESLKNLKVSLFVTYSGIEDSRIEPIWKSNVTIKSIETVSKYKKRTKLVLYWRPIVSGWNDDNESFQRVFSVARLVDAVVFTGYYHRPENLEHLEKLGLAVPYEEFARRKILPMDLEKRILDQYARSGLTVPLFRKTSCGFAYAHGLPDYNGHWGVNEICDICPKTQKNLCERAYRAPKEAEFRILLRSYGYDTHFLMEDGHIWTKGLGEDKRYHLQHSLGYQIWDIDKPHFKYQHGRSPLGHLRDFINDEWFEKKRQQFFDNVKQIDD